MMLCPFGHLVSEAELDALCPHCLIALASPTLTPVGRFQRLRKLGEGGFGCVYLARANEHEAPVALKVIRNAHFADGSAIRRFRAEIEILRQLRDERIVTIHEAGEHEDGLPFFTMEYMEGGTLRQRIHEYRGSPKRAAELLIVIAEAVEFLHGDPARPERLPILHRDLKPENILFDKAGRPHISDFGIAKLASGDAWSHGSHRVGCPWYVAPEQAYRRADTCLTAAADVYSLGAILYELFTGRPPFDGTDAQVLLKLASEEPVPPRRLVPKLDRYLETVVLNALEKDPARRYRSARAFAQDLRRALRGRPPEEAPQLPARQRMWSSLRRHAWTAAAVLWLLSLAAIVAFKVRAVRVAERDTIEKRERENASMASVQAVAFKFQLLEYAHRIARISQQSEVIALLRSPSIENPSKTLADRAQGFDSMFVLAPDGRPRARTTQRSAEYVARSFSFRDYFQAARKLAQSECTGKASSRTAASETRTAYLGQAHVSESDGQFEFAISAPICDESGWLGILGATISSNKVFGAVRVVDGGPKRITALLGPRGADRKDLGRAPDGFTFIVHPGISRGQEYQLKYPEPARIRKALGIPSDAGGLRYVAPLIVPYYRDPVSNFEGVWSAALAPVDESGFVVVVQSPREDDRSLHSLLEEFTLTLGVPFGLGLGLLVSMRMAAQRRRYAGVHAG